TTIGRRSSAGNWPADVSIGIVSATVSSVNVPTAPSPSCASRRRSGMAALAALVLAAGTGAAAPAQAPRPRRFSVIYTAEVHGAVEPCGCTSDPLGDISRLATVVQAARKETGAVLLVDGGGLLYSEGGTSARERAADELRAAFLASEFEKLGLA